MTDPKEKAELLMTHFNSRLSSDSLLMDRIPSNSDSVFYKVAFRSKEVKTLLKDLDPSGGVDHLGMVPLFFKEVFRVFSPEMSAVFRHLLRASSFPACWGVANITLIPKGPPSSVTDDRPSNLIKGLGASCVRLFF